MLSNAVDFDDPDFLDRIRRAEPDAMSLVVRAYAVQLLRAARGAGMDPARAEDVTQATLMTFLETASRFEGRSKLRTWLFGILFRKIAESRRAQKRNDEWDDIDRVFEARFDAAGSWVRPPRDPDEELDAASIRAMIADCLETAPERQRSAFVLREVEGLSTGEICKILGVTSTNLGVMLHRVRNRLRECLETRGVTA